MTRLTSALAVGLLITLLAPTAAVARDGVTAGKSGLNAQTTVHVPPNIDRAGAGSGTSDPISASEVTYEYVPICARGTGSVTGDYGCTVQLGCGTDGQLYELVSHYPGGATSSVNQCLEPAEVAAVGGAVDVLTPGRILRAFQQVPLPDSQIRIQPPDGETLINFDTVLSTRAEAFTEQVQLLGRTITLDIRPVTFTWHHGDGTTQTSHWPGRPWVNTRVQPVDLTGYITHTYADVAHDLPVSVDTVWAARYRLGNGPWADVLGTVTITGTPQPLDVLEARPVLVG